MFEIWAFAFGLVIGVRIGMWFSEYSVTARRQKLIVAGVCLAGQELIYSAKRMPDPHMQANVAADAAFLLGFANFLEKQV